MTNNNNDKSDFDADGFLEEARREAHEKLLLIPRENNDGDATLQHDYTANTCDKEHVLHHILRSANALIVTNDEIWERCKDDRCHISNGFLSFSRYSLKVRCVSLGHNQQFSITVQPEVTCQDFGRPPTIPWDLLHLISLDDDVEDQDTGGDYTATTIKSTNGFQGFPDYRRYLKKQTGLLNEAVLLPFLVKFREHLESLHVYLGTIESWLLAPSHHAQFLKDLTGTEVSIPNEKKAICCEGYDCNAKHPPSSICLDCNGPFEIHRNERYSRGVNHYCPGLGRGRFQKKYDTVDGHTLLCVPYSHGTHNSEFCLDSETDQRMLKALKEYITCV